MNIKFKTLENNRVSLEGDMSGVKYSGMRPIVYYDKEDIPVSPCVYYGQDYERDLIFNPLSMSEMNMRDFSTDAPLSYLNNEIKKNNKAEVHKMRGMEVNLYRNKAKFMILSALANLIDSIYKFCFTVTDFKDDKLKELNNILIKSKLKPYQLYNDIEDLVVDSAYEYLDIMKNPNDERNIYRINALVSRYAHTITDNLYVDINGILYDTLIGFVDINTIESIINIISTDANAIGFYRIIEEIFLQLIQDSLYSSDTIDRLSKLTIDYDD